MVSLRLISHSEKKVTTFAQARVNGATSGGQANKVNSHEESLETKANYFIISLKRSKSWPIIFIALRTNKWLMYYYSSPLDDFGPEEYFFGT